MRKTQIIINYLLIVIIIECSTKKKQPETRQPDEDGGVVQQLTVQEGLLSPDPCIWEHIVYIQTHIQPLKSIKEQLERLAM